MTVAQLDYHLIMPPKDSIVYADPPYRGTNCGSYKGFDCEEFDAQLSVVPFMVVVSEYVAPAGCVEIAAKTKTVNSAATTCTKTTEKLFVQERFADEYFNRMKLSST